MKMALIGLDLGTTTCKSVIFDEDLTILGEAYIEYPLIKLSEEKIEQDADLWWELTKRVITESVNKAGINPDAIMAIGISSQGLAFVPVDVNCRPLRNAFSWLDTRAKKQKEKMLSLIRQAHLFHITGTRGGEGYVLPKLIWFMENEPGTYSKTHKILTGHDFIIAKLCGNIVTDHTMAYGTLMYDINTRQWSDEIINILGLDVEMLPEIVNSGTVAGIIKSEIAGELGLSKNTLVCAGGQDQKCASLGAGIAGGIATVSLGTAAAITQICDRPVTDSLMRIPCSPFVLEGRWVNEGAIGTACASFEWLKKNLLQEQSYSKMSEMAAVDYGKSNNLFFFPYLTGAGSPYWNRNVNGFISGITLTTTKGEIVRSVLEGVAFQIKTNLDIMQELYSPLNEIRIFGGGSKSEIWCRIISDVTDTKVVTLYTPETANIGAAILAGLECGIIDTAGDVSPPIKKEFYPEKRTVEMYKGKYKDCMEMNAKILMNNRGLKTESFRNSWGKNRTTPEATPG